MNNGIWNLSWKDVFNCQKLFPLNYHQCRERVKTFGYYYMAFNGLVYSVNDANMQNPYCKDSELN